MVSVKRDRYGERATKKRYTPDIAQWGMACEKNYQRISRLYRLLGEDELALRFKLHNGRDYIGQIRMSVIEQHAYTDTLLLEQVETVGRWLNNPRMTVRVYHDVKAAEVISCWRFQRIQPVSDYPNKFMHAPDEKNQINDFLAEWLDFSIRFGCCDPLPIENEKV